MPDQIKRVEFAPGAFDNFEGTQDELDNLVKEITAFFENKSKEEIQAMSSECSIDELPEDVVEQLINYEVDERRSTKLN
jgi:hypothetical protein